MRAISAAFRKKLDANTSMLAKATMRFADGETVELAGGDLVSLSCEQSTSTSGSFDVGAAVIGKCDVTLNNHDRRFDERDFTGAVIVPFCGCQVSDTETEWVRLGVYEVDQPDAYAGTIALSALDNMSRLQVPYSKVSTAYPATLQAIVRDICLACGVTLETPAFDNCSYLVSRRPSSDSTTCLDVVSYAAQASGNFARVNGRGRLVIDWYDTGSLETGESWLDGQHFDDASPYASGDAADGGTFDDYSSGAAADGGLLDANHDRQHLYAFSSLTVFTDDVVVTGVRVTAQNEVKVGDDGKETNGADGETYLYGEEGYVLDLTGNKLVPYGSAATVARLVGARVVGMRFRPFSGSHVADPTVEAGDAALVSDFRQNTYRTYITTVKLAVNSSMSVSCSAKSASRNSAASASAATKAIVDARNELKREQTAREQMLADINKALADSAGLFTTKQVKPDGSTVYLLHDKKELANSKIVYKMTAEALGISTDGGKTYATALSATGDAVLRRIYAIGINADYIETGSLTVKRGGTVVMDANVSAGTFTVNSTYFKLDRYGNITCTRGTIGGFTIGTYSISNDEMALSNTGLRLKGNGKDLGKIGANSYKPDGSKWGLNFDLEDTGDYMTWACRMSGSDDSYTMKLTYTRKAIAMMPADDRLWISCDVHGGNYKAYNIYLDPDTSGASGGITVNTTRFILPTAIDDTGTVSSWSTGCYMNFKRGMLVGCSLPH